MRGLLFAATLAALFIAAGGGLSTATAAEAQLRAVEPAGGSKLVPAQPGPEELSLTNNLESGAVAEQAARRAFFRSGCILPGRTVTYNVFLSGRGTFRFRTVPDQFFDVVMRIDFPGLHRRVDRFFAGGAETLNVVKNFGGQIFGTVRISGFRGSSGCYNLSVTP